MHAAFLSSRIKLPVILLDIFFCEFSSNLKKILENVGTNLLNPNSRRKRGLPLQSLKIIMLKPQQQKAQCNDELLPSFFNTRRLVQANLLKKAELLPAFEEIVGIFHFVRTTLWHTIYLLINDFFNRNFDVKILVSENNYL